MVFTSFAASSQNEGVLNELKHFPKTLEYNAVFSEKQNFSSQKNHKVIVKYFSKNREESSYSESFKKVSIEDNTAKLSLGSGKRDRDSEFKSLQAFFANNPAVEMQVVVDGKALYPKVGILPAGHSQESSAFLQGKKSGDDGSHWKGYKRRSTVSSFQAATLSSDIYISAKNVISHPYEVPLIGPKSSLPVTHLPVAGIQPFDDSQEVNRPRHENLYDERGRRFGTIAPTHDDILAIKSQNVFAGSLQTPTPSGGFQGMPNISGYLPPDTEGAVGPNHYVQQVNSTTQVFAKDGTSLAGPFNTNTLWSGFGGRCESDNSGDAIALYDEQADRWVLTQFAVGGSPEQVCFAVSQTNDPTGSYYLYSLVTQRFPDYYKLGVWPATNNNAYFMGTNSGAANQYDVYAMDRENMLLGNPARTSQYFQSFQNLLVPADNDGALPPPADEPGYFYTIRDAQDGYFNPSPANDSLDIYSFDVDWNTPANTTFTLQAITSAEGLVDFNWTVCGFFVGNCIPQLGSTTLIDSNSWWPQQRFQYRNFGIYGSLVGVWGVNAVASPGKHTAPRWFELRKHTYDTGWNIRQQGTYAPDSTHRFSPSIAMDESQNIGVGYSVTSSSIYPSIRYTVHDNDLDDLGEMESEATMFNGLSAQTHSSGRWGDYASMDVDPSDNCTFWFTTEYIESNNWKTYIGSFKLPGCKEHNILLFDDYSTEHDINVCKVDNTTDYDLAISYDFNTPTTMSVSGCPSGANCNFSASPITYPSITTLQFTNLSAASSGAHILTVTATDGGSKTDTETLTLNLFDTLASSPTLSTPANDSFAGSRTPNLSWASLSGAQSYVVEVDDDPLFGSVDFTTVVSGLSATSGTLATESCYYWRVKPANLCGTGSASTAFRFYTPGVQTLAPIASTDVPITIPTTATPVDHLSTLNVAGVGVINDINLLNLDITHSYVGDLEVVLTSPQGTSVILMSQADNNLCGGNNNIDISLDDEGSGAAWPCSPTGNGGTYQPTNPLSAFDGESADGVWTLNVKDPYNQDGGSINGWRLEFESFVDTGNHCPPGFTVGGTVSGLLGSGLVLQNNGGDDLAIAADGSFTFSTYLDDLDPYSVTVLTQPGSPNQTCSVTNGSGSISGNNITNVTVTCVTDPGISFSGTNLSQDVCVNPGPTAITPVTLTTAALGGYSNNVNLAFNPALPVGISGGFSLNNFVPAAAPGTDSILNLSVDNTASAGLNTITVEASGTGAVTKSVDVNLNVIFPISAPTLSSPTDGSTGIAINTSFSWTAVSGASSYDIDIATDPAFSNIVSSANVGTNSYTPGASLSDSTVYYWRVRANDSCGSTDYAMAAFETVGGAGVATDTFCSAANLNLTIPDNDPNGVDNILNIATTGTITDINISVDISHTWVGDLIVGVTSPATTSVDVIDRPGYPSSGSGCSRDNIDTVLDDESATPVESVCPNTNPTIGAGPFSPNNPLSAFDSEALNGNWTMNVSDNDNIIQGTLNQWCVIATYDTGATLLPADYGDLASSYGIAKHEGGGTARLGSNWTADTGFAQDDDDNDDDGITASGNWEIGSATAKMNIVSSTDGYVACWFDWNNDGVFDNGTEKSIAQDINADPQINEITVSIPGTSTFGQNGDDFLETRCRFYSAEPVLATESPTGTASSGEVEDYRFGADQLTPITLSYSKALSSASGTSIDFSTTTETGVVGFNLYGLVNNSWKKLNNSVVGAKGLNSLKPHHYSISSTMKGVEQYQIEELKTDGTKAKYGPFQVNHAYGKLPQVTPINWAQISNNSETLQQSRQTLLAQSFDFIKLKVRSEGLQRITYEDLLSAGVDWNGVAASDISVSFENKAVARKVSDSTFAPDSYIDFIGKPADSLYTDENVYILKLDSSLAKAPVNNTSLVTVDPDAYYMSEASVTEDLKYSFASPANSPWYNTSMLVYQTTGNWSFPLALPSLLNNGVDAELEYSAWGGTAWDSFNPDHHLQVSINNNVVSNIYTDGVKVFGDTISLTHSQIQGSNSLNFIMPADTGADYDLVLLDYFRLKYPSEIVAVNDGLAFVPIVTNGVSADIIFQNGFEVGQSLGFVAKGFSADDLYAYSTNGSEMYEFPNAVIAFDNGGYNLSLPYVENSKYYVGSNSNVSAPEIELSTASSIDLSQQYDYLVISHPDFISGLAPLVSSHQNNGLNVLVVNVEDVYALYSNFRKDARGIQSFIKDAYNNSNISAVMLVGSDSYDYKDNLGLGSISFIPTMYYQTDSLISYAPVDSLFADVDSDLIPDLAIGRLPVRTVSELQNMINKMFSYNSRAYTNTAIFASDRDSSFEQHSNAMLSSLPGSWSSTSAYIGDIELTDAQQALFNNINSGVSITNYFGHSGPSTWSFEHLFDNDDVLALNNTGKPTLVNQFGCWNNYFVLPTFNTMSHSFMSLENKGAVAVLGSSTLAESGHEAIFGNLLLPYMTTSGITVGESILYSKQAMAANHPDYYDILLGWTLLGDPMMKVSN